MQSETFKKFDPKRVPSPCFVIDEVAVERNLAVLKHVQQQSGAKVLAALKAFSCWSLAPLFRQYLSGICASGYHEARLGYEEFNQQGKQGEVHVFSAAYSDKELGKILPIADHIIFNSFSQWEKFSAFVAQYNQQYSQKPVNIGLRINPQHSEGTTEIYDPCAAGSRLGIPITEFSGKNLTGISGLHFHTLCEHGLEPLRRTLAVVEEKFADYLPQMQWINFGGGHLVSDPEYDVDGLIDLIRSFAKKYDVQVYLEPGEAVAINTGVLVSEVLDVSYTDQPQIILDTSATCHMPDTLEMPYRANIHLYGGEKAGHLDEYACNYRVGGMTCLAGDVMGDYSFRGPIKIGERIMFDDMSHYTMVKTTTFNGIGLPSIAIWNSNTDALNIVKEFSYSDFKHRLS